MIYGQLPDRFMTNQEKKVPTFDEASLLWALPERAQVWADRTFPNHTLGDINAKLHEERRELSDALLAFAVADDPTDPTYASHVKEECADVIICAMRMISKLGGDPWDEVLQKFATVEARPAEYWEAKK